MVEKLLRGLCDDIIEPIQNMGRPRMQLSDMVFCAMMKVYGTLSGRRSTTDIKQCQKNEFLVKAPHYNTISKYLEKPELTPILRELIEKSAQPFKDIEKDFAIDSTGFSTGFYSNWFDKKYGTSMSKHINWLKLHIVCGVKTNIITSVAVTNPNTHDNTQFKPLVEHTGANFNMKEILGDKAYLSSENFEIAEKLGATPYVIPPFRAVDLSRG